MGKPRRPLTWYRGIPACEACAAHLFGEPGLGHAFSSVGIEHGKTSAEMATGYFNAYHDRGHVLLAEEIDGPH